MTLTNDMGPFQTIVNVSWGQNTKYWVWISSQTSSEAIASGNVCPPILPTIAFTTFGTLFTPFFLGLTTSTPNGLFSPNTTPSGDIMNFDGINSVAKRKALIDASTDYWLLPIQGWYNPDDGNPARAGIGTIDYVFLIGKWILKASEAHTDTFTIDDSNVSGFIDVFTRPLNATTFPMQSPRAVNWGAPIPELDGGPFNQIVP